MPSARRHGLMIGAGAAALALILWFSHALDGWERTSWDWRVRLLAKPGPDTEHVVLVLLDQASLDWGQQENGLSWPWPREVYGPILDFCARGGARAVAFDVLFTEPSTYGVWDDEALAAAAARSGVFIGARFLNVRPGELVASGVTDPIPELAAVGLLANVSDAPDPDGIMRSAGLVRSFDGALIPSLGLGAWLVGAGIDADPVMEDGELRFGDHRVPIAPDGTALLRYRGSPDVFPTFSAASVIQSELRLLEGEEPTIDPDVFRDKIVLFGFSAPGLLDLRPTPTSRVSPGIVVHATVVDNLLSDSFMRTAPNAAAGLGILVLALAVGVMITAGVRTRGTVLIALVTLPLPALLGCAAYAAGLWWPVLPATAAVATALFGGLARNFAVEGKQRRFIKSAFKHYLSPDVIERILVDPDALRLGGERRELTIMFSDLAGFTSLSEGLDPIELTSLLNDYLTDMTDIILEEGGTLDKYEGDAIIAFWNAPLEQPDHAARACRAAVRCQRKLAERRPAFRERCGRDLTMRMGLHTGHVVVGNMGSHQRFDYTVLGDAANLASRLEGANKAFASDTMISGATLAQACDSVMVRDLGTVCVVGRGEPVAVHQLIGLAGEERPAAIRNFDAGLARLRAGEIEAALAAFEDLSDDPVAVCFADRCRAARDAGEPFLGDWNLTSK